MFDDLPRARLGVLARRAANKASAPVTAERGYLKLFLEHVTQADRGCDFDFLRAVEIKATTPVRR